jgi:hypothetical protein
MVEAHLGKRCHQPRSPLEGSTTCQGGVLTVTEAKRNDGEVGEETSGSGGD